MIKEVEETHKDGYKGLEERRWTVEDAEVLELVNERGTFAGRYFSDRNSDWDGNFSHADPLYW